jgi:hypothetical protein
MIGESRSTRDWQLERIVLMGMCLAAVFFISCRGRSNAEVGDPCTRDESCTTGVCLRETRQGEHSVWLDGYCSGNCVSWQPCPSGTCLRLEDERSYCVSSCKDDRGCRAGYVCATSVGACLPDCRSGWSCGDTLTCNTKTGTCDPPEVTPGPIGAPCTWNVECASGLCTPEQGTSGPTYWSGGSCTLDCSIASCPSGSTCVTYESGAAFCSTSCTTSSECRSSYVCATSVGACLPDCRLGWSCGSTLTCNTKTGTCDPPAVTPGPIGAPCTWNVECASGLCTPEQGTSGPTYWSGGSCTLDCSVASCPSGSTCVTYESGAAFCSASCTTSSACRSSYVCATSVGACLPDCRLGWSCGSTLTCNTKTGTCDPSAVTPGPIGAPCTWNVECASGLCTPEQGTSGPTYWSGGSCTFDCSTVACPSGATCMQFESDGSFCIASCATLADCRSGYICDTGLLGCLPDCRRGWSCGTYFVCNGQTGMCIPPSTITADGGADASPSSDALRTDTAGGRTGDAGRGQEGPGGPPGVGGRPNMALEEAN